jgi:hypothetical protein
MNKILKIAVVTAALAAAASAQAQPYVSGDLLIGFVGASSDLTIDLGSASALAGSSSIVNLNSVISASTLVSDLNSIGGLSSSSWGAVAFLKNNFMDSTAGSLSLAGQYSSPAKSDVDTAGLAIVSGASAIVAHGANPGNSWSYQISTGTAAGNTGFFVSDAGVNPNVITGAGSEVLYGSDTAGDITALGTLTVTSDGGLTFTPVPEPASFGLLAGLGVLALSIRRQLTRAQS